MNQEERVAWDNYIMAIDAEICPGAWATIAAQLADAALDERRKRFPLPAEGKPE